MGGSQEEFPLLNSLGLYAANVLGDGMENHVPLTFAPAH